MVPLAVIVSDVFSNGPPKMGLPKWNDPIEAFALDGQDKSLRIGVQVWAPRRQQYFVATSGNVTDEILKRYIEDQDVESQDDDFKVTE